MLRSKIPPLVEFPQDQKGIIEQIVFMKGQLYSEYHLRLIIGIFVSFIPLVLID